jgi:hypothetical protein
VPERKAWSETAVATSKTAGGDAPWTAAGNRLPTRAGPAAQSSRSKAVYPSLQAIAGREWTPTPRNGKQP